MQYMLAADEDSICREWNKYAGYTVRPVKSTVDYYKNLVTQYAHTKNLIYGGTPEIRSLFQQLNLSVDLADKSKKVVRAMGRLTLNQKPISPNERFIEIDWLKLATLNHKYDFIIGDDAINMVGFDQFDLFLRNTFQSLNENGLFVCHLLVKPGDDLIDKKVEDLILEYENGMIKSRYDLASRINFICYNRQDYSMGWQQTLEILGKTQLNQFIPHLNYIDIFGLCNSKFYCPPQTYFEKILRKYFSIKEIFYPSEHDYCLFEPVYVLQKIVKE